MMTARNRKIEAVLKNRRIMEGHVHPIRRGVYVCHVCPPPSLGPSMRTFTRREAAEHIVDHLEKKVRVVHDGEYVSDGPRRPSPAEALRQLIATPLQQIAGARELAAHYQTLGGLSIALLLEFASMPLMKDDHTFQMILELAIRQANHACQMMGDQFGIGWDSLVAPFKGDGDGRRPANNN